MAFLRVIELFDLVQLDMDLGNYERFLEIKLTRDNNISTGMIYQLVPHITDAIQDWIKRVAHIHAVDGKSGPAEMSTMILYPIEFFSSDAEKFAEECPCCTGCRSGRIIWSATVPIYLIQRAKHFLLLLLKKG
ncbi:CTP synthase-like [Rosa chinensis]|uniref:CTP synthase-like n=1 Tax=Rosa chinensis TaxID=74649 RepID=UPI000D096210|nr:CTP synthase-like [Rosa chinensis]